MEEKPDEIKTVLRDIIEAQASLDDTIGVTKLAKHLKTVTYPLLARALTIVDDAVENVYAIAEDEQGGGDVLGKENSAFICGFVDTVFQLITTLGPLAQQLKSRGDATLFNAFDGLLRVGTAVKQVTLSLVPPELSEEKSESESMEKTDA